MSGCNKVSASSDEHTTSIRRVRILTSKDFAPALYVARNFRSPLVAPTSIVRNKAPGIPSLRWINAYDKQCEDVTENLTLTVEFQSWQMNGGLAFIQYTAGCRPSPNTRNLVKRRTPG